MPAVHLTPSRYPYARLSTLGAAALLAAAGGAAMLHAQSIPPAKAAPSAKRRQVDLNADQFSDITATQIRTFRGNVRFSSEGTVLRTDLAQYNYSTNVANSPGKLTIDDGQNTITGDNGKAFYQTRDAVLLGNVKIVVHPKASDQAAPQGSPRREFREPVTILCDRVDYNWRSHMAVCTGHLSLHQVTGEGVTRTVTAQKMVYQADPEVVTLTGDVHAQDSEGQVFDSPVAVLNIKEGAEGLHMGDQEHPGVKGTIYLKDEDTGAAPSSAPSKNAPAAPRTPPAPK